MKDATDVISAKDRPNLSSFDWQDPFNFSDQLTEEERMLQESVRSFAQNELQPRIFCLLYTSPSPRDLSTSRMPSSA